ncbi:hypothetical protein GWI33_005296 [Rhynchophorus ferrugineus]|uniref:Nucleolar protein 4 n=1 Tax=Rhynchophorus ferrugineus TaxID=354439 RepID=A0A834MEQ5_RHYFE|nr:hypothetical protein GWI33_005296 [Rhynchophorus ferrugineus]
MLTVKLSVVNCLITSPLTKTTSRGSGPGPALPRTTAFASSHRDAHYFRVRSAASPSRFEPAKKLRLGGMKLDEDQWLVHLHRSKVIVGKEKYRERVTVGRHDPRPAKHRSPKRDVRPRGATAFPLFQHGTRPVVGGPHRRRRGSRTKATIPQSSATILSRRVTKRSGPASTTQQVDDTTTTTISSSPVTMLAHNQHHHNQTQGDKKRGAKRKPPPERNNNGAKRSRGTAAVKGEMLEVYQPWVVRTYGDLAKTKTVTLRKYARILRTLRGEETASADTSKFRFWVKAKGFRVGQPEGYEAKPADAIAGRFSVCDTDEGIEPVASGLKGSAQDPPLYVPTSGAKRHTAARNKKESPEKGKKNTSGTYPRRKTEAPGVGRLFAGADFLLPEKTRVFVVSQTIPTAKPLTLVPDDARYPLAPGPTLAQPRDDMKNSRVRTPRKLPGPLSPNKPVMSSPSDVPGGGGNGAAAGVASGAGLRGSRSRNYGITPGRVGDLRFRRRRPAATGGGTWWGAGKGSAGTRIVSGVGFRSVGRGGGPGQLHAIKRIRAAVNGGAVAFFPSVSVAVAIGNVQQMRVLSIYRNGFVFNDKHSSDGGFVAYFASSRP